jgi:ubiquinone/menaquinone biosynthesis C-methylase UbiE
LERLEGRRESLDVRDEPSRGRQEPAAFEPHAVDWTDEKVSRFWDYLVGRVTEEFFSEKHAAEIASRVRGQRVLDIGCGTGPLVGEFLRRGRDALGVDSSPEVVAEARRRYGDRFSVGSVTSLPYPDASVDAATLIEVVEHLDDGTLDSAIREARRVLRPGGRLFITTPNSENLAFASRQCPDCGAEFHIYQHVRSWSAESLGSYLTDRGFGPVSVTPIAFRERGRFGWLVPLGFRLLGRPMPGLLAVAQR